MPRERMKHERISVLEKCSRAPEGGADVHPSAHKGVLNGFFKGCVLFFLAAALGFVIPSRACAYAGDIRVEGVPFWLRPSVERSLRSVWNEIAQRSGFSGEDRRALLSVVAERLFVGYSSSVLLSESGVIVTLFPVSPVAWTVEIKTPSLSSPVEEWFAENVAELGGTLERMLALLPLEALSWADIALNEAIEDVCAPLLPGWNPSLIVRLEGRGIASAPSTADEKRILQISFSPKPPLVLAVVPSISSSTLPVAFRSDLREKILRTLAPVVGLPIEWAAKNKLRIEALAAEALLDTNTVSNARATVDVSFSPEQLSPVQAEVESPRYTIRAWIAAYAGADGKYPEIGLHLGRNALPLSGWDVELYGEWILAANDFSLESRWGARWSPWKHILIGAEAAFPGNVLWYRLSVAGGSRSPYFWWRLSEDGDSMVGFGYRLDERISLELHYDERSEDTLTLKVISDL